MAFAAVQSPSKSESNKTYFYEIELAEFVCKRINLWLRPLLSNSPPPTLPFLFTGMTV